MSKPKSSLSLWACRCGKYPDIEVEYDKKAFYIKLKCCDIWVLGEDFSSIRLLVDRWNARQMDGEVPF